MKRSREADDQEDAAPQLAACSYCDKTFKARRVKIHERRCKSEDSRSSYKFCILNDSVFEHILGFLSNQTLTKLQSLTGDRYPHCESHLSKYCCACENDSPVIHQDLCGICESLLPTYRPLITKTEAKAWYGIQDFTNIPSDAGRYLTQYVRIDLDEHLLNMHGSRLEWVRSIAQRDSRMKKRAAMKRQKQDAFDAFLKTLPAEFVSYVTQLDHVSTNTSDLERYCERYVTLTAALGERHLQLRTDSRLCEQFVTTGSGSVEDVVDTMEEMAFLFAHTTYSNLCSQKIKVFEHVNQEVDMWYPCDEYNDTIQSFRNDAKMELCVEYLLNDRGLTLPSKWEKCRARFDRVRLAGMEPKRHGAVRYIYTAKYPAKGKFRGLLKRRERNSSLRDHGPQR